MSITECLQEALPIISKSAPIIGSIIGGVPGFAASNAISLLTKAFSAPTVEGLANAISSDPNAESKLLELEQNHGYWLLNAANLNKLKRADIHICLEWEETKLPPQSTS